MPLRHAASIVLRHYRVGEADKIVVFLTREYGKVRGMAKGARRMRSRFGGSLEVGTEIELTFFEKEGRELVSVDRCDIVRSPFGKLREPVVASTVGYFSDLVDAFVPDREPNPHVFRLLQAVTTCLDGVEDCDGKTRYFEAWMLRLAGFYPRRAGCARCSRKLVESGAYYDHEEAALLCPGCVSRGSFLSSRALEYLEQIWKAPPSQLPRAENVVGLRELASFHYRLIQHQIERDLRSHQVLNDLLQAETTG